MYLGFILGDQQLKRYVETTGQGGGDTVASKIQWGNTEEL